MNVEANEASRHQVDEWLTMREVGDRIGVSASKVRQMVRDHELAAMRATGAREPLVPASFVTEDAVLRGLSGTLTLLADHGFDDAESIAWLYAPDESLPGRPIDALRENRGVEVRRRAQAVD